MSRDLVLMVDDELDNRVMMRYFLESWGYEVELAANGEEALQKVAAKRPALYRMAFGLAARLLALAGGRRGRFRALPFAGGWTRHRDMPAPQGKTFQQRWDAAGGAR